MRNQKSGMNHYDAIVIGVGSMGASHTGQSRIIRAIILIYTTNEVTTLTNEHQSVQSV